MGRKGGRVPKAGRAPPASFAPQRGRLAAGLSVCGGRAVNPGRAGAAGRPWLFQPSPAAGRGRVVLAAGLKAGFSSGLSSGLGRRKIGSDSGLPVAGDTADADAVACRFLGMGLSGWAGPATTGGSLHRSLPELPQPLQPGWPTFRQTPAGRSPGSSRSARPSKGTGSGAWRTGHARLRARVNGKLLEKEKSRSLRWWPSRPTAGTWRRATRWLSPVRSSRPWPELRGGAPVITPNERAGPVLHRQG